MTLCTTDRADDSFAYTRQDGVFTGTADQLFDVRANCHTCLGDQLNTVFGNSRYRRRVDHFRIHTHLYGFEHITTCQVDGGCHLEG